ncbi:MAG: hypothetical protein ACK4MT_03905, partial [Thermaurantiacus tibetensis]
LWPIPIKRRMWTPISLPDRIALRAGGRTEIVFVRTALTIVSVLAAVGLAAAFLALSPWGTLFVLALLYALSLPFAWASYRRRRAALSAGDGSPASAAPGPPGPSGPPEPFGAAPPGDSSSKGR